MQAKPRRPTTEIVMQPGTPPKNVGRVSMSGYMVSFDKREELSARAVILVRTGPRVSVGKVDARELCNEFEMKSGHLRAHQSSVSTPPPHTHSRSKSDDTAPMEKFMKQATDTSNAVIGGVFNLEVKYTDHIGAKTYADAKGQEYQVDDSHKMENNKSKEPSLGDEDLLEHPGERAIGLHVVQSRGHRFGRLRLAPAASAPDIHTDHDMLLARAKIGRRARYRYRCHR